MIGPPLLKLSMKKFPVFASSGIFSEFAVAAGAATTGVVAGVTIAVTGVTPATGDIAGAAGLAIVAGFAGVVAGADIGVWLTQVSAIVKRQKLAISSVFIVELNVPGSNSRSDYAFLSSKRHPLVQQNFRVYVPSALDFDGGSKLILHDPILLGPA